MDLRNRLSQINLLNSQLGAQISNMREFYTFESDIDFIEDTLEVLASDNLPVKKSFFMDNQEEVQETLQNIKNLLNILDEMEISDPNIIKLNKLVGYTITNLEDGIDRFNKELTGQISKNTVKEDVIVTQDTIKEAINSNENTQQIVEDLRNVNKNQRVDENTAKIREGFKDYRNGGNRKTTVQSQQKIGYVITNDSFSEYCFVPGCNLDNKHLNDALQKSGIEKARLYKLTEIPTQQKQIQKTVTFVK